jgi:hypothetical protein
MRRARVLRSYRTQYANPIRFAALRFSLSPVCGGEGRGEGAL